MKPTLWRCAVLAPLLGSARLLAEESPLTPVFETTTGLGGGARTKLIWSPQSNTRYRVEKSVSLGGGGGAGGWGVQALVEGGEWVDPEPQGPRAFYRVPEPQAEVWAINPPVLSPAGGVLTLEGQCLPAGSLLVIEIEGQAPVSVAIQPAGPGAYRAALPVGAVGVPGANVLQARVVRPGGDTVLVYSGQIEITATGRASEAPPELPPAMKTARKKVFTNQFDVDLCEDVTRKTRNSHANTPDLEFTSAEGRSLSAELMFDAYEEEGVANLGASLLMPALMKAKEKANRTKCRNNLRQLGSARAGKEEGGRHTPFHNKYRPLYASRAVPGEVALGECDLALATPAGPGLEWGRVYRSKGGGGGGGGGWTFTNDMRIEPIPPAAGVNATRLYLYNGDGSRDVMVRQSDGSYRCDGLFREGRFNPDTSFTLTFADTSAMIFCPLVGAPWTGRIGSLVDANGVALSWTYTPDGRVNTVSSQFGQSLACTYDAAGRLTRVTDHTGRFVEYAYYAAGETGGNPGDLKSVTCPQVTGQAPLAGPVSYTYTTGNADEARNHNLLSITDGAGRVLAECVYTAQPNPAAVDYDACARMSFMGSGEFVYSYETPAAGVLRVIENSPRGCVCHCDFDYAHRSTSLSEFTGFATSGLPVTTTTNRPQNKLRATDPDFYQTSWRHNTQHLCTRETLPDGSQTRRVFECDLNRQCPVRERANERITTLRTAGGEERSVTREFLPGFGTLEPGGAVWSNPLPEAASIPIPGSGVDVETGEDLPAVGAFRKWLDRGEAGDAVGLRLKHRGWDGTVKGSTKGGSTHRPGNPIGGLNITPGGPGKGKGHATRLLTSHGQIFTWDYDTHGNLAACRTPVSGSGCDYSYNALGQCTSATVLNGPGSRFVTQFTYHPSSHWSTGCVVDPDLDGSGTALQITTTREYDALGRITRCVDPRGFDWLAEYDALDRVTRTQTPVLGSGPTASRVACEYFYDAGGRPARCDVEHRDESGAPVAANPVYSSFIVYDSHGRVARTATEQRPVTVPAGTLDPSPLGLASFDVTDFTYDADGRCNGVIVPAASRGQSTDRVCLTYYDECGNPWKCQDGITGAPGTVTVQYDYTLAFKPARGVLLPGLPPPVGPNPEVAFTYDGFHRLASVTDPMGNVTQLEYDGQGFVTVSVLGETHDVPGSAGNMLLARSRGRSSLGRETAGAEVKAVAEALVSLCVKDVSDQVSRRPNKDVFTAGDIAKHRSSGDPLLGHELAHVVQQRGAFRPAFFDVFAADDVRSDERFAPGAPQPHAVETTTVHRSPAGLVTSVTLNDDTLLTCTYDTAGRGAGSSDGFVVVGTVRDRAGNVVLDGRTCLASAPGAPAESFSCTYAYDALGRCVSATDGGGNNENWSFDSLGRITRFTDARGTSLHGRWDGEYSDGTAGTPAVPSTLVIEADTDGDGDFEMLRHVLFLAGECVRSSDSYNQHTAFSFDSAGRLVGCDHPDGTFESWSTDSHGRTTTHLHKDGTLTVADFTLAGLPDLLTVTGTPGAVAVDPVDSRYDGLGRCIGMDQGDSHLVFTYDSLGNQLSEHHNGHGVTRTYNHRGRTGITYSDGTAFVEIRNALGLLVSKSAVSSNGQPITPPVSTREYTGHLLTRETRANGIVTTHDYRSDGEPPLQGGTEDFSYATCVRSVSTNSSGTVLHSTRVRRDQEQNITQSDTFFTSAAQSPGRRHTQTFDRLGRLVGSTITRREVAGGPFVTESDVLYTLDLEGRRLAELRNGAPGAYSQRATIPPGDRQMSQYSSWPGGPLEWNDDGCLTSMTSGAAGTKQFVYDSLSRLVAVNNPATGTAIATYAYDAAGRRTRSTLDSGNPVVPPVTTFFVYDGPDCVQELDGDGLANFTIATTGGIGLCIISRNGTLVYPHGGGPAEGASGVAIPKFLDYMKKGKRSEAELNLNCIGRMGRPAINTALNSTFTAGATAAVTERLDCDDAGTPAFLTSDGLPRAGATGTLSGYNWFPARKGYGVCPRSDTLLSCDRYCPETGFFQGHGCVYAPQLGALVAKEKPKPVVKERPLAGHVILMR